MYLPIYVVRHYVANFYFPLLLCTHTFVYSDVMSPFFLSVLKVSTQFFHDADLIGATYMAKTCNLFTYYCYSQAEPIEQISSQILLLWCIYKGIKHAPRTTTELQPYSTQNAMYLSRPPDPLKSLIRLYVGLRTGYDLGYMAVWVEYGCSSVVVRGACFIPL